MIDVEIINFNVSKPLFSEPNLSSSSSLSSLSSSALYLTATASGDRVLANVKLTEGDGVVVAKSVNGDETFVVCNTTIEQCVCENGNGGGIYVVLKGSGKVIANGTSVID
ncbi:uncharacterized protein MONOS_3123 [Monocercomonoides exilis]|uniref:uncharacterized protein n=1 Tax=Monocercomonoides exilis TaxID=2049356 RepID=UPI00355A4EFA|nr:hypothetical protein MONOS_3123 [Monocercomonoides exilis]|eukprot:MONOS_3123.1-p1 / transcript=MONOS_3123.1 / gene=MONOS_3123 / organism=Monocercomonoides_exilis_PA203 / gene_product=unspecified product / transcript_product=unspecified product / location=Mono_scaffold00070:136178-136507(-) / protein_length=110 / sequence_SO=supercontig / SO=protein_coding / is_pseudo=false